MTTMSRRSETSATGRPTQHLSQASDNNQAMARATEAFVAAAAECQREMLSFVSMRLEKDSEVAREMMGCKNLADAAAIQSRWVEETLRDYNVETTKLMKICTNSVNGSRLSG